jgi:transcriptional regulator with XRE-family HTH domain
MDISTSTRPSSRAKSRETIGRKVRELRQARRWTQGELSKHLQLSQARLSEIERGGGSFTAEQFLQILKLFNASVTDFEPRGARDQHAELQNALARLGASELHESENVLPSEQLDSVNNALRETLIVGTPRLLTALGPVLVRNVDRVNLRGLHLELAGIGLDRRFGWLVENVRDAAWDQLSTLPPPLWSKRYRRALVVLDAFLELVKEHSKGANGATSAPDILDADIRSKQSFDKVKDSSSVTSKRWGVVTSLQPLDFATALRNARASD